VEIVWEKYKIILTDGSNLKRHGELILASSILFILGNKLGRGLGSYKYLSLHEVKKPHCISFGFEKEINSIIYFFNVDSLFMSTVLEDKLLQEKESPFMSDLLSDLNSCCPLMGCEKFLTFWALLIGNDIFNNKCLLKHSTISNLV
jgi:hypothetical protein